MLSLLPVITSPSISFITPTNNSNFTAGSNIEFTVSTSSPNGIVSNVKFYNGTTLLNTDNTTPYSYTWPNIPAGNYQIKAVATDNQGKTGEAVVNFKVNVPQGPYIGKAQTIPGIIQLEYFDEGGNGFAYKDSTPGSQVVPVADFRTNEDVDIENCTDDGAGYNIGWATAGEWLEYTVDVKTSGTYDLDLRVAANGTGRSVSVSMDGAIIANNLSIPNTGGWQTWQTIKVKNVELQSGRKIMRVTIGPTDFVNLNYVSFLLTKELKQEPFNGIAHHIPGRIEAEEYDLGGEGLAYHETNANGNEGKAPLRNDEVDIEATQDSEGAYNIGYILQGEWLEYTINVAASGTYDLNARVAADGDGKVFHIEIDGKDVTGPIVVPNTGGWQNWQTISLNSVNIEAGDHVMRIAFDASYMNLNYIELSDVITGVKSNVSGDMDIYPNPFSESGLYIRKKGDFHYHISDTKGIVVEDGYGKDELQAGKSLSPGTYFLFVEQASSQNVVRINRQ
nr:carbohydrate-binding protein [Sporocytophaga sp.]